MCVHISHRSSFGPIVEQFPSWTDPRTAFIKALDDCQASRVKSVRAVRDKDPRRSNMPQLQEYSLDRFNISCNDGQMTDKLLTCSQR
jgi:hypothetical protein